MKPLRVLVCGGDGSTLRRVARRLSDDVNVETSTRIIDRLCLPNKEWDILLVDLDGLTSFLRGLLPAIRLQFPNLKMLGISTRSSTDISLLEYDLDLDGYLFALPRTEDLIVRLPLLAADYLCDTNELRVFASQPLAN